MCRVWVLVLFALIVLTASWYLSPSRLCCQDTMHTGRHRLVGLVVKASASRAEDPGFESRLRRHFSGVESYQ